MASSFQNDILQALHLTRTGKLGKATALLHGALSGARMRETWQESNQETQQETQQESSDNQTASAEKPHEAKHLPNTIQKPNTEQKQHSSKSMAEKPVSKGMNFDQTSLNLADLALAGLNYHGLNYHDMNFRSFTEDSQRAQQAPSKQSPELPSDICPTGSRFETRSYTNAAGTRPYKVFLPHDYDQSTEPYSLLIMLHGCTQSADDFAMGTRMNLLANQHKFVVVYPEQITSANTSKCWNWFKPEHQQAGSGEPSLIAGITQQIITDERINPLKVYIAGLSAGGAKAAIMGKLYPEIFAAIGVHSGLAYGAARDLPSALMAMKQGASSPMIFATSKATPSKITPSKITPSIIFHGKNDKTVHPRNSEQLAAQMLPQTIQTSIEQGSTPKGKAFTRKIQSNEKGVVLQEHWIIEGAGHAWSGGSKKGTYTDPQGPDASKEMIRFFKGCSNM